MSITLTPPDNQKSDELAEEQPKTADVQVRTAEEQEAIDRVRIFSSRLHGLIMKLPGFAGFTLNDKGITIFLNEAHGCVETSEKLMNYAYRDASFYLYKTDRIPVEPDGTMPGKKMERRL